MAHAQTIPRSASAMRTIIVPKLDVTGLSVRRTGTVRMEDIVSTFTIVFVRLIIQVLSVRPSVSATSLARMDAVLRVQMSVNAFLTGNLTDYVQNTSGLVPIAILKEAAAKTGQTRASVNQDIPVFHANTGIVMVARMAHATSTFGV